MKEIQNQEKHQHNNRSFFSELLYRRVPQVLGLYLAGSWTFVEFSDAIISRLNLSPYWSDISLMTVLVMFPTVMMLAYRHGAPGHQSWQHTEKIGIPINIIALAALIFVSFGNKELGFREEMVEATSPDGTVMRVAMPKQEFRKRIYTGFFKVKSSEIDPEMALGVPLAVNLDLDQDPYVNASHSLSFMQPIREAGFTDVNVPLALMLQVAKEQKLEFVVTGDISKHLTQGYVIDVSIYQTDDGRLLGQMSASHPTDVFSAIDLLTPEIKNSLGIDNFIIDEQIDLPIEEQLTSNLEAYSAFVSAALSEQVERDFTSAEESYKTALELDPSFAVAAARYANFLFNQSRINEGLDMLKLASQHDYRLQLSQKFAMATVRSIYSGEYQRSKSILHQWLTLDTDSVDAWQLKADIHVAMGERELAIEAHQKLLELEPYAINRYLEIGELYTSLGESDKAITYFEKFIFKEPTNAAAHILLGDSYRSRGQLEKANSQYIEAQVLFSNDLTADRRLIENLKRIGKFDEAEAAYLRLANNPLTPSTKYQVIREFSEFYLETGQRRKAIEVIEDGHSILDVIAPGGPAMIAKMQDAWLFAMHGDSQKGEELLENIREKMISYDNDLIRANMLVSESLFSIFAYSADFPFDEIESAQETVRKYVGSGNDHTFEMIKGIGAYFSNDHTKAIGHLKNFLEDYPNFDTGLWLLLGNSHREVGDLDQAQSIIEGILLEYPAYPEAQYKLAKIHLEQNEEESARAALEQAIIGWQNADDNFKNKGDAMQMLSRLSES